MRKTGGTTIRASEVGQYAYCARAWWLSRVGGYQSEHGEEMTLGLEAHRAHGRRVAAYHRLRQAAFALLALAVLAGVGALWLAVGH